MLINKIRDILCWPGIKKVNRKKSHDVGLTVFNPYFEDKTASASEMQKMIVKD